MKAGLIGDDHVQRSGIGLGFSMGNLAQKESVNVPIHGRREQQFAAMRAIDHLGTFREKLNSQLRNLG